MTDPIDEKPSEHMAAVYMSLGRAVVNWALVEQNLGYWFEILTGMPMDMSNEIFFSGKNFNTRAELVRAAIEHSEAAEADRGFALAAVAKAQSYSSFRNRFVHCGPPVAMGVGPEFEPRLVDAAGPDTPEKFERGITRQQLDQAAKNFAALIALMQQARWDAYFRKAKYPPTPRTPPEVLLRQVELLPNDAESSELSRKQKEHEKQRLAAEKKSQHSQSKRTDR